MKFFLPRRTDTGSVWREMHMTRTTGTRKSFGDDGACTFHFGRPTVTNGFPVSGGSGSAATESDCTEATGTDAAPEASSDDDDGGDGDGDPDGHRPQQPSPLRALPCNAVKPTGATPLPENSEFELWRLPTVIKHYPVSRRTWLDGVKAGLYPQPLKIAKRAIAWRASDIRALVASL